MFRYTITMLVFAFFLLPVGSSAEEADAQSARITAIQHDHRLSETQRYSALLAAYPPDVFLGRESLHRMSTGDLRTRFSTVDGVMYVTVDPRYLRDMYAITDELRSRGVSTDAEDKALHSALVQLRRFTEARAFAAGKPGPFESIPTMTEMHDDPLHPMRYLALSDDGSSMALKPVVLNADYTVIVVSHPLCHFSRNASRQIPGQPDLATLLDGHALWLEPPGNRLDVGPTLAWQREAPGLSIGLMYATSDWPLFSSFATPSFYVFKGTRLIGMKSGWGGPEDGRELKALIEKATAR